VGSKGDSYDNALAEALNSLYKAELIRNQGPWEDIDAVELATAEWVHWFNTIRPHSAIGMRTPGRARSRLGPRRQPEQPGTITTGNHRHQINQPPQNPGLDISCEWPSAGARAVQREASDMIVFGTGRRS